MEKVCFQNFIFNLNFRKRFSNCERAALLCSKKFPNTRKRDKKDAEEKGRSWGPESGEAEGQSLCVRWKEAGTGMEDKLQAPWSCCVRGKCSLGNVCSSLPLNKYLYIHLPAGARTWLHTSRPK